jgi:aspartate/methionine/tyrosine aminotransferase
VLISSGADWVVIEDTGKTWPTQEIKAPFFSTSTSLSPDLGAIYSDFLLLGSPFAIRLLTHLVRASNADQLASVQGVVAENRTVLWNCLEGSILHPVEESFMSVSWLEVERPARADEVCARLAQAGVHVLPGRPFFWSGLPAEAEFVRIALVRDQAMFRTSAMTIGEICAARVESGA